MVRTSEDKLLRILSLVALIALLGTLAGLIADSRAYADSVTVWEIVKWTWLSNLALLVVYMLSMLLVFFKVRSVGFLCIFIVYPYGYEALILLGHIGFSGISFWMSYIGVVTCFLYFLVAVVLVFRYLLV